MENRKWTLVRIISVAEIIIGIITLSLWLLTLIGDFFTGASLWFDILLSIFFVPVFIFVIISGKMTLQTKLLGRRINGFKIWHMGDTGLFSDMKFIADYYKPDLVLIPIGGNFTMDPVDAAYAINTMIKPKMVIPIHYNSNPLAKGTLAEFQEAMKSSATRVIPMVEGQTVEF